MSLVLPSREVSVGPTVGLKGQGTAAAAAAAPPVACAGVPMYLRVAAGEEWRAKERLLKANAALATNGFGLGGGVVGCMAMAKQEEDKEAESSESSSIGDGGESSLSLSSSTAEDGGDGEEEVQSKLKTGALGSLESLEESLPIKRGLSNCFSGKSKSFASLSEAAVLGSAGDLAKVENPFNKRRRIVMACKASWQRRASYAALNTSNLWALEEDREYDHDGEVGGGRDGGVAEVPKSPTGSPLSMGRKHIKAFKSPRSFSLTDLQHA